MKKLISVFVCAVIIASMLCIGVSAREYNTEYPSNASYNSGSPVWLHCMLNLYGDVLIVLDAKTDLRSFGFDSPNGFNLINNTGSTISARCYQGNSSVAARWTSFYKLQLQTGETSYGQSTWEDYDIVKIYGTSLDLIDYTDADRGNDLYDHDMSFSDMSIFVCMSLVIIIVLLVVRMLFKPRMIRM